VVKTIEKPISTAPIAIKTQIDAAQKTTRERELKSMQKQSVD
jgi:hypothetical protein